MTQTHNITQGSKLVLAVDGRKNNLRGVVQSTCENSFVLKANNNKYYKLLWNRFQGKFFFEGNGLYEVLIRSIL